MNASATTSEFMPTPRPSLRAGNTKRINAMLTLMMAAPPTPCRMRAATSVVSESARPHTSDATVNSSVPAANTRPWPRISPEAANGSSTAITASW